MGQRVLVTGHNGYIGSVMAPMLVAQGYSVTGLDTYYYRECSLVPDDNIIPVIQKDIRDLAQNDLTGFDAVIHLAALSNDPVGNLREDWTEEINFHASARLAELARAAGVRRFLFSSSCIMYGMAQEAVVNEDSPLNPQTPYASSKVRSERQIAILASDHFSPVFMRNGTVYGLSPRMRFDTVLNNLMGWAFTTGKVQIFSDGTPWRPVVNIEDVCRSFIAVLEAPIETVHNQALNVGANNVNHQIRDLSEIIASIVPGCKVEILSEKDADQRTYKTDFSKIPQVLPTFQLQWTVELGAQKLYEDYKTVGLTYELFRDRRFTRLKWIEYLLDQGKLDDTLRWHN